MGRHVNICLWGMETISLVKTTKYCLASYVNIQHLVIIELLDVHGLVLEFNSCHLQHIYIRCMLRFVLYIYSELPSQIKHTSCNAVIYIHTFSIKIHRVLEATWKKRVQKPVRSVLEASKTVTSYINKLITINILYKLNILFMNKK